MTVKIDVVLSPDEVERGREEYRIDFAGRLVVVVDVLRATTTITTAFASGAERVIPAEDVQDAFNRAGKLSDALLCGERGGLIVDGFHMGNSPREYTAERVAGRTLIFSTTNGTRALNTTVGANTVLLACFNNLRAVTQRILGLGDGAPDGEVIMLCSGKLGRFCIEDAVCCGALTAQLASDYLKVGVPMELSESAEVAVKLYGVYGKDILSMLMGSKHGRHLSSLGLAADLEFAAMLDSTQAVPSFFDGDIRLL